MDSLSSYHLSDFILFSGPVYYRQFELYNQSIWPLHLVAVLFAFAMLYALWKKPAWAGRLVAAILVTGWVWVAYAFLYQRFYQIHVVANWYALGFVLQAVLMTWYGLLKDRFTELTLNPYRHATGLVLLLTGIMIYPLIAWFMGRPWQQLEMFVLAPDPTVIVTLGVLLLLRVPPALFVIPVVWLLISYTTLYVM
jgi:hypothetical protein